MAIAFIDLQAQRQRIAARIDSAVSAVIASGQYVQGPPVRELETQLSAFIGAKHTISCANGTDALALPLMAWDLKPGDAVFCPSFTFAATAEIVPWFGATPVFIDILPDTLNMDAAHLDRAIEAVKREGKLKPRVVIAVDLFGQPADYPAISAVAKKHGLKLIADSAQGFGATLHGKHPLAWADAMTTSFFPAKPLGCYGDGGAVLTNSDDDAEAMRSFAIHGQGEDRYDNIRIGINSRLDTIQAAILIEKLAIFADEIEKREEIAARYNEKLRDHVSAVPQVIADGVSTWAQYTIEHDARDKLAGHLKNAGVPTAIYYPKPLHKQRAYAAFPQGAGGLPVSEAKARTVISLPMHPYLERGVQDTIIEAVARMGALAGAK